MAKLELLIRDADPADAQTIAEFNARIASETEGMRLSPEVIDSGVRALLADNSKGRYWVAESDNRVIGQIMVTYEWSDWRNGMIWWLQSVYVQSSARRLGVFTALVTEVARLAALNPDVCGFWLYIEKDDQAARST